MNNYIHLTNLFRHYFYQTVFEDFNSINEIILDYKKSTNEDDWELLKQDIELIVNEDESFILDFFDRNCDGIGVDSKNEAVKILKEILELINHI